MRILVTGASGLLGQKITTLAQSKGHQIFGTYNTHATAGTHMRKVNLVDETAVQSLIAETEPDAVINTASLTNVDLCESDFENALTINGRMPGILARRCSQAGTLMVHVSTDYVFDGSRGDYNEDDTPNPINRYGKSKLEGEQQVAANSRDYCIARTSALYGWGRRYRPNFATWMLDKWTKSEEVKAVTDQYVSPTLNTNLARMLIEVAERRTTRTIHLAGSSRLSRHEFALILARKFHFDEHLVVAATSESLNWVAQRPRDSSLNVSKALQQLNNKPLPAQAALEEFQAEANNP